MAEQSVPVSEVAERMQRAGTHFRKGLEGLRRDLELQLPDDCRDTILETFDAGVAATIKSVSEAIGED